MAVITIAAAAGFVAGVIVGAGGLFIWAASLAEQHSAARRDADD